MTTPTGAPHQRMVLLVDDERTSRFFLRVAFETLGFRVLEADRGERALELIGQLRPDLILLDFRMPGMNGVECARRIRQQWEGPLLMVTGREDGDLKRRAQAAGVDRIHVKPANWLALAQSAARMVEGPRRSP